jgi:putative membrane protein
MEAFRTEKIRKYRMAKSPYQKFREHELIFRDELAIDRTILANERTLLASMRSGVSLVIAGVSMMHFSQHEWFTVIGIACIPVGLVTGVLGCHEIPENQSFNHGGKKTDP